jgi:ABC-type multidrug transport system fused ATPase/permease subunit
MFGKIYQYTVRGNTLSILLMVGLILLNGLFESVSITLIIPLLEGVGSNSANHSDIHQFFQEFFGFLGFQPSTPNVLLLMVFLLLFKSLSGIAKAYVLKGIQTQYEVESKNKAMSGLLNTRLTYLNRQKQGDLLNVTNQETRLMSSLIVYLSTFITAIVHSLFYIAILLLVSIQFTILTVVVGGGIYVLLYRVYHHARNLGYQVANLRSRIQETFQLTLAGYRVVKAYNLEGTLTKKMDKLLMLIRAGEIRLALMEAAQMGVYEPLIMLIGWAAVVWWGIQVSLFLVFMVAAYKLFNYLKLAQNAHYKISVFEGSMDKYLEMMDGLKKNKYPEISNPCSFDKLNKGIVLRNLEFFYGGPKDEFRLGPIDMDIKAGQTIGLVGRSGSGKSTICDLLLGLIEPNGGSIYVDGVDLTTLDIVQLRDSVAYVNQLPFIFHDTVYNNIALFDSDRSYKDIEESCRQAGIHDVISKLPKGYETILGEGGAGLSGGQNQRLEISRALLNKPDILILDEATSALDYEMESHVQDSINQLRGQMTIIIIAHRLSTVKGCDVIHMLDHGKLVESGPFDELLNRGGAFADLYQHT